MDNETQHHWDKARILAEKGDGIGAAEELIKSLDALEIEKDNSDKDHLNGI